MTDDYTAGEISRMLSARVDDVIARLGLDGERRGREFVALNPCRADTKLGSFRIELSGIEPGRWFDHAMPAQSGRGKCLGGDIIDLVAYCYYGGSITKETRGKAFAWARDMLGLPVQGRGHVRSPEERAADEARLAKLKERRQAADARQRAGRIKSGKAIWLAARRTLLDTPVEAYLTGRGISLRAFGERFGKLPGALRYHPALYNSECRQELPALVSLISGPDGIDGCQGCHRAWLAANGAGGYGKAKLADARKTLGVKQGGYIPIWRGKSGKPMAAAPAGDALVICEGVEDALSAALAWPDARHIAAIDLGNMGMITLPKAITRVWIAGENDTSPQAISMRNKAIRRLIHEGREVRLGLPLIGKDANDLLRGK